MRNILFYCLFMAASSLNAQNSVNWASDIAPILYDQCAKCHRDGGLGHFSLLSYADAYTNRFEVLGATESKVMPPWMPDPNYRRYAHENRLSDTQIATIRSWVNAGAPSGDMSKAPAPPVFNQQSDVGMPDLVLKTPLFTIKATDDEYRCFVIPNMLAQTVYLRGLEAIPGNHEVVHHILVYEDVTGQGRIKDQQTPEPGYVSFGGPGVNNPKLVGAWAPGARTNLFPPNMGIKLTPGADLIVQMHYPKGSTDKSDQTKLNLFFTPSNLNIREVGLAPLINHTALSLENGPLNIPANTVKTYHAKFRVPGNGSLLTVAPHMHLIGRNIVCYAVTPQQDTIKLIRIKNWNFHWQGGYTFQKVQKIPANTIVHAYAEYDNTPDNPFQPSNPPQLVAQGEATTDEMMLVYFAYTAYQAGDENIVLDSTLLNPVSVFNPAENKQIAGLNIFPNPTSSVTTIEYELTEHTSIQITLTDALGRMVYATATKHDLVPGIYQETLHIAHLPPGVYAAAAQTAEGGKKTIRVVINGE